MIKVNIFEAKARLSELVAKVSEGERVLICKRNEPVAELTRVSVPVSDRRPMGLAAGTCIIPESFYEPMSEEELSLWEDSPIFPPGMETPSIEPPLKVSEARPRFTSKKKTKPRTKRKSKGR